MSTRKYMLKRARIRFVSALLTCALVGSTAAAAVPAEKDGPQAGPGQWYISDFGIDKAWGTTTGQGVTVSIIDSGVDTSHENLTDKVVGAKDFSGSDTDGRTPVGQEDIIHHGTAVAGVIAGNGAGNGPMGVAPDAELLSASMWLGSGAPSGSKSSREQAADAIRWSVDQGAQIINLSLGWSDPAWPQSWDEAFKYAYDKDVLIVACVGNASQGATRVWSPATVPGVVGVGGVGRNGELDTSSSAPGIGVDLLGPSEAIPVPYYAGGYASAEGCSFAAPIVAGVAALIRSAHPDFSADDTAEVLKSTAKPVKGHDKTSDGKHIDPEVGYGQISPVDALAANKPSNPSSASAELASWVHMHRRGVATETESVTAGTEEDSTAITEPVLTRTTQSAPARVVGPIFLMSASAVAVILLAGVAFTTLGRSRVRQKTAVEK